jgi:peptide-methionine (S)-S-oxide reductase
MRMRVLFSSIAAVVFGTAFGMSGLALASAATAFPDPPKLPAPAAQEKESVVLAGGCFWGMQGVFEHVKGVTNTVVGYSGGKKETAHYERVEDGDTGHAESIRITYDPSKITLGEIYKIYFSAAHDPTTLNYQHNDRGPQYRSSIFYANDEQKKLAEAYVGQLNAAHVFRNPIVTKIVPLTGFFEAEEYHQHFLDRNPTQGYIAGVDIPLLNEFKAKYPEYYSKESK